MVEFLNPESVARPASRYSQGVLHGPVAKRLIISGQVGADGAGKVADGIAAQTECAFDNIEHMLAAAGMALTNLVRLNVYIVPAEGVQTVREIRNRRLGNHCPASTVARVAGLANPAYLVEIEGEAIIEG